jgi:type IV secretory pathway VirB10-like protein
VKKIKIVKSQVLDLTLESFKMSRQQETPEERQRRLFEERLRERGEDVVPRHQPVPAEYPVDSSESASIEQEPQPHSGQSDAAVVDPHPVVAYQIRQNQDNRRHHTRRRAQWLFTQAAQVARDEANQARRLQRAARAPRRLRSLVARTLVQVRALQMRSGLVAVSSQSSVTTDEDMDWYQDMEVEKKNNDGGDDSGDGGAGGCCSTTKYGPQASRRVGKYGPR